MRALLPAQTSVIKGVEMRLIDTFFAVALLGGSWHVVAADDAAAEALGRKSGCFKCHDVTKKKDAPPYKEIAAKYKGKADASKKLMTHLTTSPKVKVDGEEEPHDQLKTKNPDEISNVIEWILSR